MTEQFLSKLEGELSKLSSGLFEILKIAFTPEELEEVGVTGRFTDYDATYSIAMNQNIDEFKDISDETKVRTVIHYLITDNMSAAKNILPYILNDKIHIVKLGIQVAWGRVITILSQKDEELSISVADKISELFKISKREEIDNKTNMIEMFLFYCDFCQKKLK